MNSGFGDKFNVGDISDNAFWQALDKLVSESKIVIDRPRGSRHPKYSDYIYPIDYGYLENTSSMDGGGIDVGKARMEIISTLLSAR